MGTLYIGYVGRATDLADSLRFLNFSKPKTIFQPQPNQGSQQNHPAKPTTNRNQTREDAHMSQFDPATIEALADAWASIDGKVEKFRAGKGAFSLEEEPGGHYSGYMAEAEEMLKRLLARGFIVSPAGA